MKKLRYLFCVPLLLFWLGGCLVCAESPTVPSIPLPPELDGHLGEMPTQVEEISAWWSADKLLSWGFLHLESGLGQALQGFFWLLSVAALSSVMASLTDSVENSTVASAFRYMSVLCAATLCLSLLRETVNGISEHIGTLSAFAAGVIPSYTGICTAAGFGGLSLASGSGLSLAVSFGALLAGEVLTPLLGICFILGFAASVSGLPGISQIAETVRRFFTGCVGVVAALLCAVFAFQTEISAKADNLAGRTVRYVATSALPLVGGALSETSRTLSGAFSVMGGMVGGIGVAVVVMMLLPTLLRLWTLRLGFLAAGGVAEMLSLPALGGLYREGASLLGAFMAILAIIDTVLIFEFAILMRIG